jgi:hypothetical protein
MEDSTEIRAMTENCPVPGMAVINAPQLWMARPEDWSEWEGHR